MTNNMQFKEAFNYKVIYAFTINDEQHKGLIKIGDATLKTKSSIDKLAPNCRELNQAALTRIKSYTNTAGIVPVLLHTELAVKEVHEKDGSIIIEAFRDHDVHDVLENSNIKKVKIKGSTGREWYRISKETALESIKAVKNNYSNLSNSAINEHKPIIFRPEQKEAIEKTVKQFKKHDRMLWNAKMRFGKTLSTLEVIKRCEFKKSIILTHRPVVNAGWYEDFTKIFYDTDYLYGSKTNGYSVNDLNNKNCNFVYFASIQDLRGSEAVGGKWSKNSEIFDTVWDLVIVDEAHEGTKTSLGDDTIKKVFKEELGQTKLLALSGTPFNILDEYDEDSIYTWDYIMEQECKSEWDKLHFGDSNPYEELPELRIYTYDLGDLLHNSHYITYEDKAFNFHEFFRTWTGDFKSDYAQMPEDAKVGDFVHEQDVWSLLNLMTKQDEKNCYPYSKEEYRDLFKHSLWMVPGVKEAKALKNLMSKHPVFGSGQFNIVNVAGNDDEESSDALNSVKAAIKDAEKLDMYTITLSCGKLTTGVTIKEWTAVFYLAGSYLTSASNYLQTIFRVQSPCNKNGKIKDTAYVFDFAPDRTLKMVSEAVSVSSKAGKTDSEDRVILGKFLNYCPVISITGSQMKEYTTCKLLQQLKKAYADKVVKNGFDDKNLYNDELLKLDEMDIKKFNNLKGIIGESKAQPKQKGIPVNEQGLTNEEYEKEKQLNKKKKNELTPEEKAWLEELKKKKKTRNDAISILRGISIRMPLLIYGADIPYTEEITLDRFIELVDESSWNEFMPRGVTKEIFNDFKKYYDEDVFISAGRKIRNIAREADTLEPTERVKKIASLFSNFKNPDKETVLTPWRVVNMHMSDCLGGYDFWDENHEFEVDEPRFVNCGNVTSDTFKNTSAQILEINSKTGLYPLYVSYSIFREKCSKYNAIELSPSIKSKLWNETIQNNIFIICKTPMAKQITQRTLSGYTNIKINAHYFDDLVNQMQNKPQQFINRVSKSSYWKKGDTKFMKFDAIVGNPPYQENIGSTTNQSLSKQLFPSFIQTSINMKPRYLSLITPSRWFTANAQDRSFLNLRKFIKEHEHFVKIYNYLDNKELFGNVTISGGVNYFLYEETYQGLVTFIERIKNHSNSIQRPLFEDGLEIIIPKNDMISILRKVTDNNFKSIMSIVTGRNPFGVPATDKELEKVCSEHPDNTHTIKIQCAYEQIKYITKDAITKREDLLNSYKVFTSKMNGAAGLLLDEKPVSILGRTFIADKQSVCSNALISIGQFSTKNEAENLDKYMNTKFFRFMIGIKKISQVLTSNVYEFAPLQDFTNNSDIKWSESIDNINKQLYQKYHLEKNEIQFIEEKIKDINQ